MATTADLVAADVPACCDWCGVPAGALVWWGAGDTYCVLGSVPAGGTVPATLVVLKGDGFTHFCQRCLAMPDTGAGGGE